MSEFQEVSPEDIASKKSPLSPFKKLGELIRRVAVGAVKEAQGEPQRLNPFSTQPPEAQTPTNK